MYHGACQGCTPGGKVECMLTKKDRTELSMMLTEKKKEQTA